MLKLLRFLSAGTKNKTLRLKNWIKLKKRQVKKLNLNERQLLNHKKYFHLKTFNLVLGTKYYQFVKI